ncbi:hypothetical protein QAD02_006654 [Eretmocerus hayati]|uniref:Uncharacterized protein n=1 Tax=Eretmocerus hayati TaxID=131215 RepID=A0ACC2N3U7_9HYME|nr:hypothetical protein QAD02_006654 [Eretmocerus hayati]
MFKGGRDANEFVGTDEKASNVVKRDISKLYSNEGDQAVEVGPFGLSKRRREGKDEDFQDGRPKQNEIGDEQDNEIQTIPVTRSKQNVQKTNESVKNYEAGSDLTTMTIRLNLELIMRGYQQLPSEQQPLLPKFFQK